MKIFINYAHVDKYRVIEVVNILRSAEHEPWFDHDLMVGRRWDEQLREAIQTCDCFLYALTPESIESKWCQWEFAQAVHMGKPIIPVLIQGGNLNLGVLSRIQYADFREGPTAASASQLIMGIVDAQPIPVDWVPLLPIPSSEPYSTSNSETNEQINAQAFYEDALAAFKEKDYEMARDWLLACLDIDPDHVRAEALLTQIERRSEKQPTNQISSSIFISHSSNDDYPVTLIHDRLEQAGFDTFTDHKDIMSGDNWDLSIQQALDNCVAGIFVASEDAIKSKPCLDESNRILAMGKPLFIVNIDNTPFETMPLLFTGYQQIDLSGDHFDAGINQLIQAIRDYFTPIPSSTPQDSQQQNESSEARITSITRHISDSCPAMSDCAAKQDALGFTEYANALANTILAKETVPPLVIGIYGSWGSGKSTLMEQVRDTIKKQREEHKAHKESLPQIISISYDAWAYSDADRLWAGLVKQIAAELDAQMTRWQRIKYVANGIRKRTNRYFGLIIQAVLIGLILGALALLLYMSQPYIALGSASLGIVIRLLLAQNSPVSYAIGGIAAMYDRKPAAGVISDIQDELRRGIDASLNIQNESASTISTEDHKKKAQAAAKKAKIIIYIDELDRCPLERIVDILEAIKLFLAEDIFIVLMAVDTRVVSEAIRLHYKEVENSDLPREYLEKIVQIPVSVPRATEQGVNRYVNTLMQVETIANDKAVTQPTSTPNIEQEQAVTPIEPVVQGEINYLNVDHLPDQASERDMIIKLGARLLDSNPRRIKRLLNTYRYIRYLLHRRETIANKQWQEQMLVWLTYSMCWPDFMAKAVEYAQNYIEKSPEKSLQEIADENNLVIPDEAMITKYLELMTAGDLVSLGNKASNFLIECAPESLD